MGSLSPTAVRRVGRIAVPIVAALATVLASTQGASAATPSRPPVHASICVQQHRVTGMPSGLRTGTRQSGVVVTKPGQPGLPGQPGMVTCAVCGAQVKPGSDRAVVPHRPAKCVICVVHITTGGSGSVSSSGGGTVTSGTGPVKIGSGSGGGVVVGKAPMCPPLPVDPIPHPHR